MGSFFNEKMMNRTGRMPANMEGMRRDFNVQKIAPLPVAAGVEPPPAPAEPVAVVVNPDLPVIKKDWAHMNQAERREYRKRLGRG